VADVDVVALYRAAAEYAEDRLVECCRELESLHDGEFLPQDGHVVKLREMCRGFAEYNALPVAESMVNKAAVRRVARTGVRLETAANLKKEQEVADYIAHKWQWKLYKYAGLNPIDRYAVYNDQVTAWIEIKCRNIPADEHKTVFMSARKYVALQIASMENTAVPLFVVRWSCGSIRCIDVRTVPVFEWRRTGHNEPRVENDVEPVVEVDIDSMRKVCGPYSSPKDQAAEGSDAA
jgi:hypothetical protein